MTAKSSAFDKDDYDYIAPYLTITANQSISHEASFIFNPEMKVITLIKNIEKLTGIGFLEEDKYEESDQSWFWTEYWQRAIKQAKNDIENGRCAIFNNIDDALAYLS
jgi:hypothetical protein